MQGNLPASIASFLLLATAASNAQLSPPYQFVEVLVHSRFATTVVTTTYNNEGLDRESHVHRVVLPTEAFVTNFTMETDRGFIVGRVEEAAVARQILEQAKADGNTAATVARSAERSSNEFVTEITIESGHFAIVTLTYQQVLQRTIGYSRIFVHIPDEQTIPDFDLAVGITEKDRIAEIIIPEPGENVNQQTNDQLINDFDNNLVQMDPAFNDRMQTDFGSVSVEPPPFDDPIDPLPGEPGDARMITWNVGTERSTAKDLVILYDTEYSGNGNEVIQTVDGFFVHFITPDEEQLQTGDKNIVFCLDKSGSMKGPKFAQLQLAMENILYELSDAQYDSNGDPSGGDKFAIMMFSTGNELYKNGELLNANDPTEIEGAIRWIQSRTARGYTNISGAITEGIDLLKRDSRNVVASGLIFLTDGLPTRGILKKDKLVNTIVDYNTQTDFHIHTLSFGVDADYPTLQRISQDNRGVARKIFTDSMADIQLEGFFKEVAQPMLTDVAIEYSAGTVEPESLVINSNVLQSPSMDMPRFNNGRLRAVVFSDATINNGSQAIIVGRTKPLRTRRPKRPKFSSRFQKSFGRFSRNKKTGSSSSSRRASSPLADAPVRFRAAKADVRFTKVNQNGQVAKDKVTAECDNEFCMKNTDCKKYINPDRVKNFKSLFKPLNNGIVPLNTLISVGELCPVSQWSPEAAAVARQMLQMYKPQSDAGNQRLRDEIATSRREDVLAANTVSGIVQRFWAYQTVQRLITEPADTDAEQAARDLKAVELSKKYNFVNELTSMVVVDTDGNPFRAEVNEFQEIPGNGGMMEGDSVLPSPGPPPSCSYPVCIAIPTSLLDLSDAISGEEAQEYVNRALKGLKSSTRVCLLLYSSAGVQQVSDFQDIGAAQSFLMNSRNLASAGGRLSFRIPSGVRLAAIFDRNSGPALGQLFGTSRAFSKDRSVGLYAKTFKGDRVPNTHARFAAVASATKDVKLGSLTKSAFDRSC